MFFRVDPSSAVPVYAQIAEQVKHAIASGLLEQGARLPSIRELAKELRVNPNTIIRSYRELENDGIIESRRGQGSFVTDSGKALTVEGRTEILAKLVDQLLVEAYHLKLSDDQVMELVRQRMTERSRKGE